MSQRTRRLGERIKEIVAEQLLEMKDPRIGFVTVTDVRVSTDVSNARVFYTVLPDDEETRAQTSQGLASALPAVRRELGRRLRTRNTPALEFVDDPVPAHGRHIDDLIDAARRSDSARAHDEGDVGPGDAEDGSDHGSIHGAGAEGER